MSHRAAPTDLPSATSRDAAPAAPEFPDDEGRTTVDTLLELCTEALGLEHGVLFELTADGAVPRHATGRGASAPRPGEPVALAGSWAGRAALGAAPLFVPDVAESPWPALPALGERACGAYFGRVFEAGGARWLLSVDGAEASGGDPAASLRSSQALVRGLRAALDDAAALARLTAANERLNEYTHTVAHDLRAPLRTARAFSAMIAEDVGPLPGDAQQQLDTVVRAVERMDTLVDDLLSWAHAHEAERELERVELDRALDDALVCIAPERRDTAELERRPLPAVRGDGVMLTRVLAALLDNAFKFVAPGERAQVTISAGQRGDLVEVRIADRGIGIDPSFTERVFEPFRRLHPASEYEGSGLGLSIARAIVARHGGTLDLRQRSGGGSEFVLALPAADDAA